MARVKDRSNYNSSELDGLLGYHLRRASATATSEFNRQFVTSGMRQVLFGVVAVVAANPGISQSAVARILNIKRANIVTLINELIGAKIVTRSALPDDKRTLSLHLTAAGQRKFAQMRDQIRKHEGLVFARYTAGERAILIELLGRLAD